MKRRVSPVVQIKPLTPGTRGLFLYGWGEARRTYALGSSLLEAYTLSDDSLRELWHAHRADVTAEADRLLVTPWARDYFSGEVER